MNTLSRYSEIVASWAGSTPEVHRAWIFGSYASGKAHAKSDLDVAIDVSPDAISNIGVVLFWFRHHSRLLDQLQALVGPVPVQLEMYHRHHGSIVYRAINSAGLKPVYKRQGHRPNNSFKPKPLRGSA